MTARERESVAAYSARGRTALDTRSPPTLGWNRPGKRFQKGG
jgi:hypothetical protein